MLAMLQIKDRSLLLEVIHWVVETSKKKKKKWKSKHYVNNNSLQFVYLYISVDAILYGHVCSCVYTSLHFMKQILK